MTATITAFRANKYKGKCSKCSTDVLEGVGYIIKSPTTKKWLVFHHPGDCPAGLPVALKATAPVVAPVYVAPSPPKVAGPDGVHKLGDDYFRVSRRKGYKGVFVNVQKLYLRHDGTGSFRRVVSSTAYKLTDTTLLTYAQAQAFGREHSFCVVCGAHLEDALSIFRGIGPVCEKRPQFHGQSIPKRTVALQREAVDTLRKAGTHQEHSSGKFTLKKTGVALTPKAVGA